MDKILHDPKDPKLWELWYIPYYGSCRILSINRTSKGKGSGSAFREEGATLKAWATSTTIRELRIPTPNARSCLLSSRGKTSKNP